MLGDFNKSFNGNCGTATNTSWAYAQCPDVDECGLGFHDCHKEAECTNTHGSFNCQCRKGFIGDGHILCKRTCYETCAPNGHCSGEPDYTCNCDLGWTGRDCSEIVVATITPRVYVMALESVTFARVGRKGNFVNGALLAPTGMQLRLKLGAGCVNATGMAMLRLEFVIRKPASVTARTTPKDLSVKCAIGNITVIQKVVGNVTSNVNLAEY
jgi:hypothetical protein